MITKQGLQILEAIKKGENPQAVYLSLKGVTRPEELTATELKDLSTLMNEHQRILALPGSIDDVTLTFNLTVNNEFHAVVLGKLSELDLTLNALELLEDFNPDDISAIPLLLGCIYAPSVKSLMNHPGTVPQVAFEITEAIKNECEFKDVYSVYCFFVFWKEILQQRSSLSVKQLMRLYRHQRRLQIPTRYLLSRLLRASRLRLNKLMSATSVACSYALYVILQMCLWLYSMIVFWLRLYPTK